MVFQRKSGLYASNDSKLVQSNSSIKDYGMYSTGAKRHQFTSGGLNGFLVMASGAYGTVDLLKFVRNDGVTDDTPPSATASNNYQSNEMMNGSYCSKFKAVINIENSDATVGTYLDIYEVAVSFWDVYLWNAIYPTACPYTFSTSTGPPDIRGRVNLKAVTATLVVENVIKNHKFLQHYIKKKGTIYVGPLGQSNNKAQIVIDRAHPKCRRSNNGMYWGLIFHNNSDKNGALGANLVATAEYDFLEHPTENRLPYLT